MVELPDDQGRTCLCRAGAPKAGGDIIPMTAAKRAFVVERSVEPFYLGEGKIVPVLGTDLLLVPCAGRVHVREAGSIKSVCCIGTASPQDEEGLGMTEEKLAAIYGFDDTIIVSNTLGLIEVYRLLADSSVEPVRSFKTTSNVPAAVMAHSNGILAVGFTDGIIRLFSLEGGFSTAALKGQHSGVVSCLLFTENGKRLVSAGEDGVIVEWDVTAKGKVLKVVQHHTRAITSLCSSSGSIVSGSRDGTVAFFTAVDLKLTKSVPVLEAVETILPLSDTSIAFAGEKGVVRVVGAGQLSSRPLTAEGHQIRQLLQCQSSILVVTSDSSLISLDAVDLSIRVAFVGNLGEVTDAQPLPDGRLAVATGDRELKLFDSPGSFSCRLLAGHTEAIVAVAVSKRTGLIVTGSRDNTIRLWSTTNSYSQPVKVCNAHTDVVSALAVLDSDPDRVLIASGSADLTIKMWRYDIPRDSLEPMWTVKGHERDINAIVFASPSVLVSASQDKTAGLWDVSKGASLGALRGHKRGLWTVSSAGDMIATGSADKTIKLWSLSSKECLRTLEGHTNSVLRLSFLSPPDHSTANANQLVSVGSDGLLKVWDWRRSECLSTLDEHTDRIWALCTVTAADSGDVKIVTGDSAGTLKVWRDCTDELEAKAGRERAEMLLKEQELSNLIRNCDYHRSLAMTVAIDQPGRSLSIITDLLATKGFESALDVVQKVLQPLDYDSVERVLKWSRDWNTSFKRSLPANLLLRAVLSHRSLSDLQANVKSFRGIAAELAPYHERHIRRLTEMAINSYTIDLALQQMSP